MATVVRWSSLLWMTPLALLAVAYALVAVPMQDYLMLAGVSHSQ